MHLPLFLLLLLPRTWVERHLDGLRFQLTFLNDEERKACAILAEVDAGHEYTEGFRAHLQRKLDDWKEERKRLVDRIADVEELLYPVNSNEE